MPYRRRRFARRRIYGRRRFPRRAPRRRRFAGRKRATRSRTGGPLGNADRKFVKLNYARETVNDMETAGDAVFIGINPTRNLLNFGYTAPDTGNYRPTGFREWCAFYRRVRVRGIKVSQQVTPQGDNLPYVWYRLFSNVTWGTAQFARLGGQPYSSRSLVSGKDVRVSYGKQYMSTKKMQGISELDDTYFVKVDENGNIVTPTERSMFYATALDSPAAPPQPQSFLVATTITYYLEFSDRRDLLNGDTTV